MKVHVRWVAVVGIAALCAAGAAGGQTFEAITAASVTESTDSVGALVVMDTRHLLTPPTLIDASALLFGLARNPVDGQLYSVASSFPGLYLARVDFASGAVNYVGKVLSVGITSLAFDSSGHLFGYADCDSTYPDTLFQLDPASGAVIGVIGTLDSARTQPCTSGISTTGAIAIDPGDDTLYYAGIDTSGDLFVDRMSPLLVPTLLYDSAITLTPVTPLAATVAGGTLWVSTGLTLFGPGAGLVGINLADPTLISTGASLYRAISIDSDAVILGLVAATPPCLPSTSTACLFNRFQVAVTYDATPASGSGPATVLLESSQSVKFSFFDPTNIELIVKMVDACTPPFNQWWVAAGGLTNVGVSIQVTDTTTHSTKTYNNAKGTLFQAFFDTAAFPCP